MIGVMLTPVKVPPPYGRIAQHSITPSKYVLGQRKVWRGRERLPVGHDLDRVLELAAQDAGQVLVGDDLARRTPAEIKLKS